MMRNSSEPTKRSSRSLLTYVGAFAVTWLIAGVFLAAVDPSRAVQAQSVLPRRPGPKVDTGYGVQFTYSRANLIGDLLDGPRGDRTRESGIAHGNWYSREVRGRYGAWGPPARHYPVPAGAKTQSLEWRRERVIATALLFEGYGYQHHHIPDWEPPTDWPWKPTAVGDNGKGVDCSNFTAFVYNLAFGLKTSGDVHDQSERLHFAALEGENGVTAERISLPGDYDGLVRTLKTGDLLFIRNRAGTVSHVVLWVGPIGRSTGGTPLVLDSHGEDVKDDKGVPIPAGVQLRPFRRNSWYFRSASHALRVFRD